MSVIEQKEIQSNALQHDVQNREKALRKAKEKERETLERQQKLDARGKQKQEKAGVARIMMNTLRNNAENSTSKLKRVHREEIDGLAQELLELRSSLPDIDKMKFGFNNSFLHKGKILFTADQLNFDYGHKALWLDNLNFQITSGERIALKGLNGSGKTTLIKLLLGSLQLSAGTLHRAAGQAVYIDQDYSLLDPRLSDRLKREHKVETNTGKPQIAYRETLTKEADGEGKLVKQSGGRGQYGHVVIKVRPGEKGSGIVVENKVVGGTIPKEFINPAKNGCIEAALNGIIAGYPVIDMHIDLVDGSSHDVVSNENAFKMAGIFAVKDALKKA